MHNSIDYSLITESPGLKATQEQIARLYQRYHFAIQFAKGKDVLEVACGSGVGLGYLAKVANKVVGGDIDEKNVALSKEYSKNRDNVEVDLMDAHNLPFPNRSFDIVLLYEAIYYLREPQKFVSEAERVLREDKILIICTVNKDWKDFHPSPYTYKYFSVPELYKIMKDKFKEVELYVAFSVERVGLKSEIVSLIKRIAMKFDLIPGSLKARAYLKRVFIGKLVPLPEEVYEGMTPYETPVLKDRDKLHKEFKIIYVVAKK